MRKYAIIVLVSLLIVLSYFAFVQWNKLHFSNLGNLMFQNNNKVDVVVLSSEIKPETNKVLVPVGAITFTGQVTEIVVEYTIMLDSKVDSPMELKVDACDIMVNSKPNPANVVNIEVIAPEVIFNSAVTTQLAISISAQHLSQSQYLDVLAQIENSNINYNVLFSVSKI